MSKRAIESSKYRLQRILPNTNAHSLNQAITYSLKAGFIHEAKTKYRGVARQTHRYHLTPKGERILEALRR